jgi:hypothetical protein
MIGTAKDFEQSVKVQLEPDLILVVRLNTVVVEESFL